MASSDDDLPHLAAEARAAGTRGQGDFNERAAIGALGGSGQLASLPWDSLRPGDLSAGEPAWIVTDRANRIVAGFVVVELAFTLVQVAKAKLELSATTGAAPAQHGEAPADAGPVAKPAQVAAAARERLAKFHDVLAGVTDQELADGIVAQVDMGHPQHGRRTHLVIHEPAWLHETAAGSWKGAVRRAGEHGKAGFAAVWHVDGQGSVTRVA